MFAVLGTAYFLERWRYFGHPLPNAFYVKGGGHLFFSSLQAAPGYVAGLVGPLLPLLAFGFYSRATMRRLMLVTGPLVVFVCAWVFLSNEMNYNMRFQYAVVPLVLMTLPGLLLPAERQWRTRVWPSLAARPRLAIVAAVTIAALMVGATQHFATVTPFSLDGRRDIGELLASYRSRLHARRVGGGSRPVVFRMEGAGRVGVE